MTVEEKKESSRRAQVKYREKNRELLAKKCKAWRGNNKEHILEYNRRDEQKAKKKEYKEKNREKIKIANKIYRENNKEKEIARRKKYNDENRDIKRESQRKYSASARGRLKNVQHESKRRALKISSEDGTITTSSLLLLKEKTKHCVLCSSVLDYDGSGCVHLDHIIPLSKGGTHSLDNVRWVCARCNLIKGSDI